jgi:hypothetical protein
MTDKRDGSEFITQLQAPNREGVEGRLVLCVGGKEAMVFCPSGEVFVRGEKVDSNRAVYDAFRAWLSTAQIDPTLQASS